MEVEKVSLGCDKDCLLDDISKATAEHLLKISNVLSSCCPAASRIYRCNLERYISGTPDLLKIGSKEEYHHCKYCGSLWSPGKYKVRIIPCRSISKHEKKLLLLETEQPWKLTNKQRNKLNKFKQSSNKIVYSCEICRKKTIFPGDKKPHVNLRPALSSTKYFSNVKKKNDLNAGLFILSTSCPSNKYQMVSEKNKTISFSQMPVKATILSEDKSGEPKTPVEDKISIQNENKNIRYQITPNRKAKTPESTISSNQKKSNTKKRKTLLDQILKQEQSNKKKTSLSSFLVSLS